jgi:AcrR family transcriptional regulator
MSPRTTSQNEIIRAQRKNDILEAALTVFAERGYAASTIEQVARAAGTSKGLVYNYFQSKEALLKAIFDAMRAQSDFIWQFNGKQTAKHQLKNLIDATFLFLAKYPRQMRLMLQLALQPEVVEDLKDVINVAHTEKHFQIEPLLTALGYNNPVNEAHYLGALLEGIALGMMVMGENYPLDDMKKCIYDKYDLL